MVDLQNWDRDSGHLDMKLSANNRTNTRTKTSRKR